MQTTKKDIRALTKEQLREFFVSNGDKAFRGNQVYEWLWSKRAHSFEDMTNVSKETRTMLENNFVINHIKVDTMQRSEDDDRAHSRLAQTGGTATARTI